MISGRCSPSFLSGTVTFLFTDVEGSTRLLHELGAEAYAEALAEHRWVIREACIGEGGVEVDTHCDANASASSWTKQGRDPVRVPSLLLGC